MCACKHSLCDYTDLIFLFSQSLDELDDDDGGQKDRKEEEQLVQANTFQNEAMTADPATGHLLVRYDTAGGRRTEPHTANIFSLTTCGGWVVLVVSLSYQKKRHDVSAVLPVYSSL